jgi:adenosylmethionine-8-amino-7-oxononanoate aminotransferase
MPPLCIKGQSRQEIAAALPRAIKTALASYQRFTAEEEASDAKSFKAHHDACKVAIAHIDLLLKLADWVGAQEAPASGINDALMSQMIESARAVKDYEDTRG